MSSGWPEQNLCVNYWRMCKSRWMNDFKHLPFALQTEAQIPWSHNKTSQLTLGLQDKSWRLIIVVPQTYRRYKKERKKPENNRGTIGFVFHTETTKMSWECLGKWPQEECGKWQVVVNTGQTEPLINLFFLWCHFIISTLFFFLQINVHERTPTASVIFLSV